MEQTETPTLAAVIRADVIDSVGSVRAAAIQSGIAYTTLDRRLRGTGSDFSVVELRNLSAVTGRDYSQYVRIGGAA